MNLSRVCVDCSRLNACPNLMHNVHHQEVLTLSKPTDDCGKRDRRRVHASAWSIVSLLLPLVSQEKALANESTLLPE